MALVMAGGMVFTSAPIAAASEQQFHADLQRLTSAPHRLSGTAEGQAAIDYIVQRLGDIGVEEVLTLPMPVWQTQIDRCEIVIDGQAVGLEPLRPNAILPPTTPADGVSGPLVYVGRGELLEYGDRSVDGAIVAIEYDSEERWRRAFSLGAKAVIFLGDRRAQANGDKFLPMPAPLIRLYAGPESLERVDLRQDRPQVTVYSHVTWKQRTGRSVIAVVPGTDPGFVESRVEPEALVFSADVDTFGAVPRRSPGAHGAANVAALLEAVEHFQQHPPRRDVIAMFLDNHARYHQGARHIYDAMLMPVDEAEKLLANHRDELAFDRGVRALLDGQGHAEATDAQVKALIKKLDQEALRMRTLVNDDVVEVNLLRGEAQGEEAAALDTRVQSLLVVRNRWDQVRRVLNSAWRSSGGFRAASLGEQVMRQLLREATRLTVDELAGLDEVELARRVAKAEGEYASLAQMREAVTQAVDTLHALTAASLDQRVRELEEQITIDGHQELIRRRLGNRWVIFHASYDLADVGPTWSFVAGHSIGRLYPHTRTGADTDTAGYHKRLLTALAREVAPITSITHFETRPIEEPDYGRTFAARDFVPAGMIAGIYGLYNVSIMTGYDARLDTGHPSDVAQRLDWRRIRAQAGEALLALEAAANSAAVSLPRPFRAQNASYRPKWSPSQTDGNAAVLKSSGSLTEDWPAAGGVAIAWPSRNWWASNVFGALFNARLVENWDPFPLVPVDANGRFALIGVGSNDYAQMGVLVGLFDELGNCIAITTQDSIYADSPKTAKAELFPGRGFAALHPANGVNISAEAVQILRAASNSRLRPNRSLYGQNRDITFFFAHEYDIEADSLGGEARFKIVQADGPLALAVDPENPVGRGIPVSQWATPMRLDAQSARDYWWLNELRLSTLRQGGVILPDLERLHARAGRQRLESEQSPTLEERVVEQTQALALGRKVYAPLRQSMDDLIRAIVILLLLTIPFAFSLERLLICSSTVYGRLAGFATCFLATFIFLYVLHPGFSIAATPIIILLAFTIILLSGLVCYIIIRKFRTEIMAMQSHVGQAHSVQVSATATLLAAVGMGMSTMRRRPLRTTLTAVTVVMLTFTILCFASFTSQMGVRRIYEGPAAEGQTAVLMLRNLDYGGIGGETGLLVGSQTASPFYIAEHRWKVRQNAGDVSFSVARQDSGQALTVDAVMGLDVEELELWPALADVLVADDLPTKRQALDGDGLFLPRVLKDQLDLNVGDPVLLGGYKLTFAGVVDVSALQRLRHLDGKSVLPVDFVAFEEERRQQQGQTQTLSDDRIQRDFRRLSPNQVAIMGGQTLRRLGAGTHVLTVYPRDEFDIDDYALRVAEQVEVPVWARTPEGVSRLFFTELTSVSGGFALVVPILLGGFIIFGTMLGSITDREKEIYTFSALGLGPAHVGFLFFAEAAVYAVIGGMGGQILAQLVALIAAKLAEMGLIPPPSINFSSTNSLFAIGVVMATVLVSAVYPAYRASKSANPGLARAWKMPPPEGDRTSMTFPFTVSAYDITGVVSFLAEHFRQHDDAGLGIFACTRAAIERDAQKHLVLRAQLALAPFDLGVTQDFSLRAVPSEIPGVDEIHIEANRLSGAKQDWIRANRTFITDLRQQFLFWRTLSPEAVEDYRRQTLESLGDAAGTTTMTTPETEKVS